MRHFLIAVSIVIVGQVPMLAVAQKKTLPVEPAPANTTEAKKKKAKKVSIVDKQIADAKARKASGKKVPPVLVLLESMYYGPRYYYSNGPRYFIARVVVANLSGQSVTIKQEQFELTAKGKTHKMKPISTNQYSDIYIGTKSYTIGSLKPAKSLAIKPNAKAATWVVFSDLGTAKEIIPLKLSLNLKQPVSIDVNAVAKERLKLTVERIGPRKSLGLLTIAGRLNTISLAELIQTLDNLLKEKPPIGRFVIYWKKGAPAVNGRMNAWLQEKAKYSGVEGRRYYTSYPYPDLPGSIRELHLAAMPGTNSGSRPMFYTGSFGGAGPAPNRIHKTAVAAVGAALKSAYEILPRKEIVAEIQSGHPLTRAAALAAGGGRLGEEHLPMILDFANGKDETFAQAAIVALRHFGEKQAIRTLVAHASNKSSKQNQAAIVSLSASRFPAAHRALLRILKSSPLEMRKKIVTVLASNPRPIWSEPIYAFASKPDSGIGAEAIKALGVIGHPKLVEVLTDGLKSKDAAVRTESLKQLIIRANARTDKVALEYTLKHLKTTSNPPDSYMRQLLLRTKDARAIPLLMAQLDNKGGSKHTIIDTLSKIGDQKVGRELLKRYSKVKSNYDKGRLLQAIVKLKTPGFMQVAENALMAKNSTLIRAACEGLQRDGSREAVQMLVKALEKSTYSTCWSYTSSALSQVGTKDARTALVKIRDGFDDSKKMKEKDKQKLRYVVNAIRSLMQRSPAYSYVYQGWRYTRQKKYKEALEYLTIAHKVDADHPWPLSARGHVYLLQKKFKEARVDLEKAFRLDPHDPHAITGVALLKTRDKKFSEAVQLIEKRKSQFTSDRFFPYHAARVYGRTITAIKQKKLNAADKKKIAAYEKEAMNQLKIAITRGRHYSDGFKPDHARNEADFAPLRHLKEYKTLIGKAKKKKKNAGNKAKMAEAAGLPQ